jgi:hypothetical protein
MTKRTPLGYSAAGVLILTGALILAAASLTGAGERKKETSADKVKVSATATKPDATGQRVITLKLAIDKGWYIYGNPVGAELLEPNKTLVTVKAGGKKLPADVDYPKAKIKMDKTIGNYRYYEGEATIKATVNPGPAANQPLEVTIKVNACDTIKGVCLKDGEITVKVP